MIYLDAQNEAVNKISHRLEEVGVPLYVIFEVQSAIWGCIVRAQLASRAERPEGRDRCGESSSS